MACRAGTGTPVATRLQLAAAAYGAGLRNVDAIAKAVAVARAESGGRVRCINDTLAETPSSLRGSDQCASIGAWQINLCNKREAGSDGIPRRAGQTLQQLQTIQGNAAAMAAISQGGSRWGAWSLGHVSASTADREAARQVIADPAKVPAILAALGGAGSGGGGGGGGSWSDPDDIGAPPPALTERVTAADLEGLPALSLARCLAGTEAGAGALDRLRQVTDAATRFTVAGILREAFPDNPVGQAGAVLTCPLFWIRLGMGAVGTGLILTGVVMIVKDTAVGGIADQVASGVAAGLTR